MVAHTCNRSTQVAETGGWRVPDQPGWTLNDTGCAGPRRQGLWEEASGVAARARGLRLLCTHVTHWLTRSLSLLFQEMKEIISTSLTKEKWT
jgi:hypothetical protein